MNVGGRGDTGRISDKLTNAFDVERVFSRQQVSQCIGHSVLAFVCRQFQNLYIHFVRDFLRMSGSQRVPRHAKTARRKHLFAILIAGEGTRFSYQRINDVAIIDGGLVFAHDSWHRLDQMTMMRHSNLFGTDAKIDELTDQPTWYRIRVGTHIDCAAATDASVLDDVVGVEHCIGQSLQMSKVIKKLLSTIIVGFFYQIFDEGDVGFPSFKVATAAQHQRLIDTILEMSVGGFHVAVFVGTARVRTFCFAVVITHECRISLSQFSPTGVISYGGSQRIAAMPFGYAAKVPERFLNAGTERFKRFGKTERDAFDVAVRQHAMEKGVIESVPGELHAEFIAHRKVTGGQSSRIMLLIKEDRLAGAMQTSPLTYSSLKSATCRIRKLAIVSLLQPLKQRLRFKPRLHFEPPLHCVPHIGKGISAGAIAAIARLLGRQVVAVTVFAGRFLAHFRHPCRITQSPAQTQQPT